MKTIMLCCVLLLPFNNNILAFTSTSANHNYHNNYKSSSSTSIHSPNHNRRAFFLKPVLNRRNNNTCKLFSTAEETDVTKTSPAGSTTIATCDAQSTTSTTGVTSTSTSPSKLLASDDEFLKPSLDKRHYRSILLPNNLQVLLVSDPQTDVEAAAVHIKAGHFDDPMSRPGLAHFHEHMIFLGNAKYPGENDFDKFVSKNGGVTNAFTDMEDTNYYFNVAPLNHDEDGDDGDDEDEIYGDGEDMDKGGNDIDMEEDEGFQESEEDEDGDDDDNIPNTNTSNENGKVSLALSGALDRFAQFFISPSFNEDSVERELRAIDSEYLNSMTSDSWRNYQLLKFTCDQRHPFAKFGCGNYYTLTNGGNITGTDAVSSGGSSPRDDLVQFWETKYVAENMKLCVVGKASLDELQQTVEASFADVRSKVMLNTSQDDNQVADVDDDAASDSVSNKIFKTENSKFGISAFGPDQLGIVREYIPVVETRIMKLLFAVPPSDDPLIKEYRPDRVLSHLIGHESPGSLHALLSEEGMIEDLSSGAGVNTADFSLFSLSIQLTSKGMAHRDYVLSLVWKWINLIRATVHENKELMEKYHDELRLISETHFRFRENGDPTDFCSNAAELLFDYEPSKILAGSALPGPYNDEVVKAFLDRLNPDNVIINIHDQNLENETIENTKHECSASAASWEVEKYYRAKYRDVKVPSSLKEKWSRDDEPDARLHLPALNDYLPSDFSLRSDDSDSVASADPNIDYSKEMPKLLVDRPGVQMWHKLDRTFRVPKTSIRMLITTPNAYRSPRTMTLSRLYVKVLEDDLNSFIYDASLAGCRAKVACSPSGYSISVSGYSEKLPHLLDVVTGRMLSIIEEMKEGPDVRPGLAMKFDTAVKNLLKDTKNYKYETPYETASYISRMLLESNVSLVFLKFCYSLFFSTVLLKCVFS